MDVLVLVLGLAAGVVLGWLAAALAASRRAATSGTERPETAAQRHLAELTQVRRDADSLVAGVRTELAAQSARAGGLERQLRDAAERYRDLQDRHAAESEVRRRHEQEESTVLQALAPVREQLRTMQGKVTELEAQRSRQHGELAEQLRSALDSEERLRATAESLASALRSNSTRGVWGETQLRSVVQAAGLLERVDFDVQQGITTSGGAGRPDMVVHLPGGKSIAVDAKVPFNAYLEAVAIPSGAPAAELARREQLLLAHRKAVRDHVTALGARSYWEGMAASPELVIAFIPSESLISTALEADPSLLEYAFERRVALASPVTLWSVLKTIAFSWQQDVVTEEAEQLFDLSRELHGRLTTMAQHVEKLGRSIERSVKDYNVFVGSLERQVLPSARRLVKLDAAKALPAPREIEEQRRGISSSELLAELGALQAADDPAA